MPVGRYDTISQTYGCRYYPGHVSCRSVIQYRQPARPTVSYVLQTFASTRHREVGRGYVVRYRPLQINHRYIVQFKMPQVSVGVGNVYVVEYYKTSIWPAMKLDDVYYMGSKAIRVRVLSGASLANGTALDLLMQEGVQATPSFIHAAPDEYAQGVAFSPACLEDRTCSDNRDDDVICTECSNALAEDVSRGHESTMVPTATGAGTAQEADILLTAKAGQDCVAGLVICNTKGQGFSVYGEVQKSSQAVSDIGAKIVPAADGIYLPVDVRELDLAIGNLPDVLAAALGGAWGNGADILGKVLASVQAAGDAIVASMMPVLIADTMPVAVGMLKCDACNDISGIALKLVGSREGTEEIALTPKFDAAVISKGRPEILTVSIETLGADKLPVKLRFIVSVYQDAADGVVWIQPILAINSVSNILLTTKLIPAPLGANNQGIIIKELPVVQAAGNVMVSLSSIDPALGLMDITTVRPILPSMSKIGWDEIFTKAPLTVTGESEQGEIRALMLGAAFSDGDLHITAIMPNSSAGKHDDIVCIKKIPVLQGTSEQKDVLALIISSPYCVLDDVQITITGLSVANSIFDVLNINEISVLLASSCSDTVDSILNNAIGQTNDSVVGVIYTGSVPGDSHIENVTALIKRDTGKPDDVVGGVHIAALTVDGEHDNAVLVAFNMIVFGSIAHNINVKNIMTMQGMAERVVLTKSVEALGEHTQDDLGIAAIIALPGLSNIRDDVINAAIIEMPAQVGALHGVNVIECGICKAELEIEMICHYAHIDYGSSVNVMDVWQAVLAAGEADNAYRAILCVNPAAMHDNDQCVALAKSARGYNLSELTARLLPLEPIGKQAMDYETHLIYPRLGLWNSITPASLSDIAQKAKDADVWNVLVARQEISSSVDVVAAVLDNSYLMDAINEKTVHLDQLNSMYIHDVLDVQIDGSEQAAQVKDAFFAITPVTQYAFWKDTLHSATIDPSRWAATLNTVFDTALDSGMPVRKSTEALLIPSLLHTGQPVVEYATETLYPHYTASGSIVPATALDKAMYVKSLDAWDAFIEKYMSALALDAVDTIIDVNYFVGIDDEKSLLLESPLYVTGGNVFDAHIDLPYKSAQIVSVVATENVFGQYAKQGAIFEVGIVTPFRITSNTIKMAVFDRPWRADEVDMLAASYDYSLLAKNISNLDAVLDAALRCSPETIHLATLDAGAKVDGCTVLDAWYTAKLERAEHITARQVALGGHQLLDRITSFITMGYEKLGRARKITIHKAVLVKPGVMDWVTQINAAMSEHVAAEKITILASWLARPDVVSSMTMLPTILAETTSASGWELPAGLVPYIDIDLPKDPNLKIWLILGTPQSWFNWPWKRIR